MKNRIILATVAVMMAVGAKAQMFSTPYEHEVMLQQQMMDEQQKILQGQVYSIYQQQLCGQSFDNGMPQDGGLFGTTQNGYDPIMDIIDHGGTGDQPGDIAPIGSGTALLVAMGAAYAAMRRRKENK